MAARSDKDPLEALERAKARGQAVGRAGPGRSRSQVDDLTTPIVAIKHGRGMGCYITRWITASAGKILEHQEETHGIAALSRLLRDTIRRPDAERIVQHIRRTSAYGGGADGRPRTVQQAIREPDERRRQEAMQGLEPAWKLDRDRQEIDE